jgi:hypothetical protein
MNMATAALLDITYKLQPFPYLWQKLPTYACQFLNRLLPHIWCAKPRQVLTWLVEVLWIEACRQHNSYHYHFTCGRNSPSMPDDST